MYKNKKNAIKANDEKKWIKFKYGNRDITSIDRIIFFDFIRSKNNENITKVESSLWLLNIWTESSKFLILSSYPVIELTNSVGKYNIVNVTRIDIDINKIFEKDKLLKINNTEKKAMIILNELKMYIYDNTLLKLEKIVNKPETNHKSK